MYFFSKIRNLICQLKHDLQQPISALSIKSRPRHDQDIDVPRPNQDHEVMRPCQLAKTEAVMGPRQKGQDRDQDQESNLQDQDRGTSHQDRYQDTFFKTKAPVCPFDMYKNSI
jgi:hypothetical protein